MAKKQWAPMPVSPGQTVFDDPDWVFQPQLRGQRTLAHVAAGKVRLQPSGGEACLLAELAQLDGPAILDGVLNQEGYFVFDLLALNGQDLRAEPWEVRNQRLSDWLREGQWVRLTPSIFEHGQQVLQHCLRLGLAGIVAKRRSSAYVSGKQSGDWLSLQPLGLEQQLLTLEKQGTLWVEGQQVEVTRLGQQLWPDYSKRDFMIYLVRVSRWLLPHLRDRPLTLVRYYGGSHHPKLRQKSASEVGEVPAFVHTTPVWSDTRGTRPYLLCNNLPSLLWLAEIHNLELHPWLARATPEPGLDTGERGVLDFPEALVFDLDCYVYSGEEGPDEEPRLNRPGWQLTCEVAYELRELLDGFHLPARIKTSGKTGLHVLVPLPRQLTFQQVRTVARDLGQQLTARHAGITMEWSIPKRCGKIFLDASMNQYGKTVASLYSPRVGSGFVSYPLSWDQLDQVYPSDFTMENVPGLLARHGDPWE